MPAGAISAALKSGEATAEDSKEHRTAPSEKAAGRAPA